MANNGKSNGGPNVPMIVGLAAVAGGAAFLFTRRAKADPVKPDPVKPKAHATIGDPYAPGFSNEKRNAVIAAKYKPKDHPRGTKRKSVQNLADWLANVVLYETYPQAPTVIPSATSKWAKVWIRLRKYVRTALKKTGKDPGDKVKPKTDGKIDPSTGTSMPDRAAEIRNSVIVVKLKPRTFPKNDAPYNKQRAGQPDDAWWANVVLWQTYPKSPRKLSTKKKSHRPYVDAWKRINTLVRFEIVKAKKGTEDGGTATPGDVPTTAKPGKSDIAGAAEMRNAAIAAVEVPITFERNAAPYNAWKGSAPDQKLADWLTNVAYWTTYPNAPVKLSGSAKGKKYVAAWVRIRGHVKRAMAKAKSIGPAPVKGLSASAWKKWAAMMAVSSNLRADADIRDAYAKAVAYLNGAGAKIYTRDVGKKAGPHKVTLSGILAEAAIRVPTGQLSQLGKWLESPSRAFWVTNTMF